MSQRHIRPSYTYLFWRVNALTPGVRGSAPLWKDEQLDACRGLALFQMISFAAFVSLNQQHRKRYHLKKRLCYFNLFRKIDFEINTSNGDYYPLIDTVADIIEHFSKSYPAAKIHIIGTDDQEKCHVSTQVNSSSTKIYSNILLSTFFFSTAKFWNTRIVPSWIPDTWPSNVQQLRVKMVLNNSHK